jgi:long-subunit fatty acid transport protein
MNMKKLTAVLALLVTGLAMAQAPASAVAAKDPSATPGLDRREARQQKRIDQGVASGQLNAAETNRLDKREAKLKAHETAAKADGKVTPKERRRLQKEADRASAAIHRQKHDPQTAASAAGK